MTNIGLPRRRLSIVFVLLLAMAFTSHHAAARSITDAAGRIVEIPDRVQHILPAGPPAALILYTLAPDKMLGWAHKPGDDALALLDPAAGKLPALGALTDGGDVDAEAIKKLHPDLIIDIGSIAPRYRELADRVQTATGIPYILLDGRLDKTPELYRQLGQITGEQTTADMLAKKSDRILSDVLAASPTQGSNPPLTTYYGRDEDGLTPVPPRSISAEVLALLGLSNVVPVDKSKGKITSQQLLAWNPAVILTMSEGFAAQLRNDPAYAPLSAVKDDHVLLAPKLPFGWIDEPPSVNRLLGLLWVGHALRPERFTGDLRAETRSFFHDFYRHDLSDTELDQILKPR
jgi:iron complex transport system substrate-binding protein